MPVGRRRAPLLVTQFAMPAPPASAVARPRLGAVLTEGLQKASRSSARRRAAARRPCSPRSSAARSRCPPGSRLGVRRRARPLLGGVLTALRAAGAVPEDSALDALAPPVRESRGTFMPLFVNALAELPEPVVLVLDDLHVLRSRECLAQLSFLLLHAPPTLRLVLEHPRGSGAAAAPAARPRAAHRDPRGRSGVHGGRGGGAACYPRRRAPRALVGTLCARTEGWGAGLRLAALSLQDREDPERFVEEFAGDDRAVGDYLLAEVLDRQPPRLAGSSCGRRSSTASAGTWRMR